MKNLERNLKALANKRRLAIIKYLKGRKSASVGDISDEINLSFRSTSKHLSVLTASDIVEKEQRSSQVFYSLSGNQNPPSKRIIELL